MYVCAYNHLLPPFSTDLKHAVVQQVVTNFVKCECKWINNKNDKPGPSRRRRTDQTNDRERETEKKLDRNDTTGQQRSERQAISNSDLNEVSTSDRVKGKSKMPVSEQEWD
jgi:hypothetical protein